MRIHCTEFVSIELEILPSLQKWPVLDAVSHKILVCIERHFQGLERCACKDIYDHWMGYADAWLFRPISGQLKRL